MAENLGLAHLADACFKRKFRYTFEILGQNPGGDIIGNSANVLMPLKGGLPEVDFKETDVPHVYETIYLPGRPEWKAVNWTLYDYKVNLGNPVFRWLTAIYDPRQGNYRLPSDVCFKRNGALRMVDGCGEVLETWIFDNMWPQHVKFGDVDYGVSEVVTCEVTLRYDRAYLGTTVSAISC